MSRQLWTRVKESKFFYVRTYRRAASLLIVSSVLNVIFLIWIFVMYITTVERAFYATSGITPPIQLTPMKTPNASSEPLLPNEPVDATSVKPIPN